jgi:hypothetical protein
MRQLFLVALLVSVPFQIGCSDRENVVEAGGEMLTDASLQDRIESKINSHPDLSAAGLSVDADADRLEATVSGTVGSYYLRSKALELARSAYPGLNVESKIEVK